MCYWYVCQNVYRYSSEIVNLIRGFSKLKPSALNVCSVGCGPATELIAIEECLINNWIPPYPYKYVGFDFNTCWTEVQQQIKALSVNRQNINFMNCDVFDYYSQPNVELPNLIVLNYMLSDMLKFDKAQFSVFLDNIIALFARIPGCGLLINDINIGRNDNEVRYYYEVIINKVNILKIPYKSFRFHFADSQKQFFAYGRQWQSNELAFQVPSNISQKYDTNTECHSAQLLIVRKD